jgi:hypothetical protein
MSTPLPPPLPSSNRRAGKEAAAMAATISVAAGVAALVAALCFDRLLKGLQPTVGAATLSLLAKASVIVTCGLLLVGLVAAVVAVAGGIRSSSKGIIGKGLAGGLMCLLLGAIFVPNFLNARRQRLQAQEEFISAVTNLVNLTPEDLSEPESIQERLTTTRQAMDRAAEKASGTEAAMMRASSAYFGRIQAAAERYTTHHTVLTDAEVLSPVELKERGEIERRRGIVRDFVGANEHLAKTISSGADLFEEELRKAHLPERAHAEVMSGFKRGFDRTRPISLKIRALDAEFGQLMMSVLDLLDGQWGKWRFDADDDLLYFDDDTVEEKYTGYVERIDELAQEQEELQRQLLEAQSSLLKGGEGRQP